MRMLQHILTIPLVTAYVVYIHACNLRNGVLPHGKLTLQNCVAMRMLQCILTITLVTVCVVYMHATYSMEF